MAKAKSKAAATNDIAPTTIQNRLYPTSDIEENTWNTNVMPADKYGALGEDMKRGGPNAINPILIAPKRFVFNDSSIPENLCIVVDGNHRLRKAKELRWSGIRYEMDLTIDSEEKARAIGYKKNTEHGEMDPYRLAEYFAWFVENKKMTHEEIAKLHNVDRTTVTKALSLLKIEPTAREKLKKVPRVTISHLEPIATLDHGQQGKIAKEIARDHKRDPPTVKAIEHRVRDIKEEARRAEILRRAVEKAKFKKCPTCGKPPERASYKGFPWVSCGSYHDWSLDEGIIKERRSATASGEPKIPQSVKSERIMSEFSAAFRKALAGVLSRVDANGIESIDLYGRTKDGKEIRINSSFWDWRVSMDLESAGQKIDLSVSDCKIKDHPEIKTRIKTGECIDSKQKLAKLERQIEELFRKFGEKGAAK